MHIQYDIESLGTILWYYGSSAHIQLQSKRDTPNIPGEWVVMCGVTRYSYCTIGQLSSPLISNSWLWNQVSCGYSVGKSLFSEERRKLSSMKMILGSTVVETQEKVFFKLPSWMKTLRLSERFQFFFVFFCSWSCFAWWPHLVVWSLSV